jgi:hypothetical protein
MNNFNAILRTYALAEQEKFINNIEENEDLTNDPAMTDVYIMIMEDKDILVSHLDASKENVENKIGDKETEITKALTDQWTAT